MTPRVEQVFLACCMTVCAAGTVATYLLSRPTSWLSRFIDSRECAGGAR